jgi:outer membrane protein assembly factor BamA
MHRKSIRTRLALLPLLLTLAAFIQQQPAGGQQQLLKPQSIRFEGLQEYTPNELLPVVGITKGQVYTSDFLNQTAQKLMGTGVFEKVGFKFDGVDLTYLIRESADLYPVVIDNLPLPADFDARLHQRFPLYHGRVPSEGTLLDDVQAALQQMIKDQGLDAKVTYVPAGDNPNKKATSIKFRIDSPAVAIGDVQLSGVSDALLAPVNEAIKRVAESFVTTQSQNNLQDQIASVYRFNGYATASVQAVPAGKPTLANGIIRVPFAVSVTEGRAYTLGKVQIDPNLPVAAEVEKLCTACDHPKDAHYLGTAVGLVTMRMKAKGYLDCKVTPHASIDEAAGVVNYTIDAVPGPQYHLGLLKFDNVSNDLRSLLMRNWQMMPGDPFDETYVSSFMLAAQKSDPVLQRTLAGVKASYDVHADPESHDVNLVIRLSRQ